ncbi:hypothetical protein DAD54_10630 [Streptococcus agalactiae]|uniref:hypothetical protein n=1 Tax=Streptococcus agalactiae TaxID=1311 RepID=UPI00114156FD|nr:hypothetical protein [Streptococcus agalactiae]TQC31398.1 hypothetical protein DAD54_10630 [Streptococcus agalactiae]
MFKNKKQKILGLFIILVVAFVVISNLLTPIQRTSKTDGTFSLDKTEKLKIMNKQLYWTKNSQTQKFKINKEKRYVYNGSSQYHYNFPGNFITMIRKVNGKVESTEFVKSGTQDYNDILKGKLKYGK